MIYLNGIYELSQPTIDPHYAKLSRLIDEPLAKLPDAPARSRHNRHIQGGH